MDDLGFNILCLIGTVYLFWRIAAFFKNLLQLVRYLKEPINESVEDKIPELCNRNLTFAGKPD
jgi:hypothetical protein